METDTNPETVTKMTETAPSNPQPEVSSSSNCSSGSASTSTPGKSSKSNFQVPATATVLGEEEEEEESLVALRERVYEKEEHFRKLKLVQLYKRRWEKSELSELAEKWKAVAQAAILELYEKKKLEHQDITLEALLNHFKIDHDFIGFDAEEEAFV